MVPVVQYFFSEERRSFKDHEGNNIDYSLWERGSNDRIIIKPIILREREREREREKERERK